VRLFLIIVVAVGAWFLPPAPRPVQAIGAPVQDGPCATAPAFPGRIERVVLTTPGAYGNLQYRRTPLGPRTVAITVDDGPDARGSQAVMSILEARCLRATFFYVGQYAQIRPDIVRDAVRRGHNVGSHSWSHPTRLAWWGRENAQAEIRRGFLAVENAAPGEVEPFFRFPGLGDSRELRNWLSEEGIAVVGAEAGTDDWRGIGAEAITRRTLANLTESDGGVLIIHETHPAMIAALPGLLDELNRRGFRFVQITAGDRGRIEAQAKPQTLLKADRAL
jgi:peptidoglycan/xylan/chitin deacetylase (PgdA/CDA1 family)